MLAEQRIRYAVAVATPRDTHSLAPSIARSQSLAPRSLCLPESDQEVRASGVWSEPARHDWLASRLAAKRAATALLRRSAGRTGEIEIVRGDRDGRSGTQVTARQVGARTATRQFTIPLSLSISLAHADGHAIAAAAAHPARIGVDLEREGRISTEHADYFLSPLERAQRGALTLTELWALKEAAWKALGCGDTTTFAELELVFDAGGCVRALRLGAMVLPASAELLRPWPGWVGAIVAFNGILE
jgi:phosphopantetheinyl transferase (holo-ACP synthase)